MAVVAHFSSDGCYIRRMLEKYFFLSAMKRYSLIKKESRHEEGVPTLSYI